MITVEAAGSRFFTVKLKRPVRLHTDRMKQVPGARFVDKDTGYRVPMSSFDEFEDLFWDEIVYITPRHILLNEAPPPPPKFYDKITKRPVPGLKQQLFPFQAFGAAYLEYVTKNYGMGFLIDKMGLGKTPQAIAASLLMIESGDVDRVLVVVLASLRKQWQKEGIQDFTNESSIVINGDAVTRKKQYEESIRTRARYTIISYETMLHDYEWLRKHGDFDLVIFDEAHKLKNRMGKMNRMAELICNPTKKFKGIKYAFFLTGTPMMNNLEELYGLFKIKDRGVMGTYEEFCEDFMNWEERGRAKEIVGYKNLSELRRIIKFYMLRRTELEARIDLPEATVKWHYSDTTALQEKLEAMIADEKVRVDLALQSCHPSQLEKLENARKNVHNIRQAIANHPELLLRSASERIRKEFGEVVAKAKNKNCPKFYDLLDFIDEAIQNGDKIVVFSQFKRMVDIIHEQLRKEGVKTRVYHGEMSDDEKQDAVMDFRQDPDIKVLICTEAGSTGLNLQVARVLINYDLPWNPAIYGQRNGRIRRINSKHDNVLIINMLTEGSIDEEKKKIIKDKEDLFNATVENDEGQSEALARLSNE